MWKIFFWSALLTSFSISFCQNTSVENFKLITVLYNEKNKTRIAEYLTCLEINLANKCIDEIHIVYDTSEDNGKTIILNYIKNRGLPITYVNGRTTYAFCIDLANKIYPNSKIILSNADIYFNKTLTMLDTYNLTNTFLVLTRWNTQKNGHLVLHGKIKSFSQDSWIFSTPFYIPNANILIGTIGCDATIAFNAQKYGLYITNPCLSIQACHLHLSSIRNYDPTFMYPNNNYLATPYCTIATASKNRPVKQEAAPAKMQKIASLPKSPPCSKSKECITIPEKVPLLILSKYDALPEKDSIIQKYDSLLTKEVSHTYDALPITYDAMANENSLRLSQKHDALPIACDPMPDESSYLLSQEYDATPNENSLRLSQRYDALPIACDPMPDENSYLLSQEYDATPNENSLRLSQQYDALPMAYDPMPDESSYLLSQEYDAMPNQNAMPDENLFLQSQNCDALHEEQFFSLSQRYDTFSDINSALLRQRYDTLLAMIFYKGE